MRLTRRLVPVSLIAAFVLLPASALPKVLFCPFHLLTGQPCPLCGLTRALCHLAKGGWQEALALHPLSPLVLLAIVLAACAVRLPERAARVAWRLGALAFVALGLLRAGGVTV